MRCQIHFKLRADVASIQPVRSVYVHGDDNCDYSCCFAAPTETLSGQAVT